MAKQTKITIETESLLVLHGRTSIRAWCPQCGSEVEMVALESTAVVSNLEPAAVTEWCASEELHHSQKVDGSPLICLNSLLKRIPSQIDKRDGERCEKETP
jgi:hypothetical protein